LTIPRGKLQGMRSRNSAGLPEQATRIETINYNYMALEITDLNFDELLNASEPLVVDFWAEWCGPCKMIAPVVEELANSYAGKVNIGKMDVDENNEISSRYGIRNIPTVLFFKNGQLVDKQVGATQKSALAQKIEALLS